MTALMLATDEGTASRKLNAALADTRARRTDSSMARLLIERAFLSQRILAGQGEYDIATVARFQDVTRAIEATMVMFRERRDYVGSRGT